MRTRLFLAALATLVVASPASAATRTVGPGMTYATIAAAAAAAADGDTIEIAAGTYHEEVVWTANGLTIRGVGEVVIDMTGIPLTNQGGKGIFILDGADTTVEHLTFVGASDGDGNGAGIRWQGGGMLTVRDCVFRGDEDGILGGNHPDNVALVENNEFVGNGLGDFGFTHSIYINEIDTLTFRGNWSHDLAPGPDIGHLFKSRAHHNYVLYNRLTAQGSHSSYELQLPEGGIAYVIGNLIEQGSMGPNRTIVSIGGDGMQWPDHHVFLVNNTIVNDDTGGTFVNATAPIDLDLVNNLFVGPGTMVSGGNVMRMSGNLATDASVLVSASGFDYHLVAGSMPVDMGVDPGSDGAMSLVPTLEYAHPRSTVARSAVGAIDVGAYEFGNVAMVDAGGGADAGSLPGADAGTSPGVDAAGSDAGAGGRDAGSTTSPGSSGGCACGVTRARDAGGASIAILAVVLTAVRRRARARRIAQSKTLVTT